MREDARVSVIDDYIGSVDDPAAAMLSRIRDLVREAAPEATERMAYGMPTWWLNGNLVHAAVFARHVGFYPGADGVAQVEGRLADFVHAKGSIQFPLDRPLPEDLVRDVIAFRVTQQRALPTRKPPEEAASRP